MTTGDPQPKKETHSSSSQDDSVDNGEIQPIYTPNRKFPPATVINLDTMAMTNEKDAARLLREAQANLEFSADTGYASELKRGFSVISLMGVGYGITNSWLGISASLVVSISSGGPMMIIYGIIIIATISLGVASSLSEMASAYPNAAGQIYWTMKLAPKNYNRFLSYITGMLGWLGSVFTSASVTMALATAVLGMYMLFHPDEVIQSWQVFLVYQVCNVLVLCANIYEKPLPHISKSTLFISILSCTIVAITVLAMHKGEFESAEFVFVEFHNNTGWSSSAIAFMVGLVNPNWSFSCLDAATHIAEESLNPAVQIPQAIFGTVIIGFVSCFAYSIAVFFCLRNLDDVLNSNTGVPIIDIYYQATGSKYAALGLELCLFLTIIGCNIACHTWSSRVCWSFSRDNGIPLSKYWSRVNQKTGTPVNAHIMSCFWVAIIGFIFLASSTAFNSVIVSCVTFLLLSYLVPTVCLIYRKITGDMFKPGPYYIGRWGYIGNVMLCCWAIIAFVIYNLPYVMPVTGGNMNYSSVVFAIVVIFCTCDWHFRGKKQFVGIEEREQMREQYVEQLAQQVSNIEAVVSKTETTKQEEREGLIL